MGITFRNGTDKMGIKAIDKIGSYHSERTDLSAYITLDMLAGYNFYSLRKDFACIGSKFFSLRVVPPSPPCEKGGKYFDVRVTSLDVKYDFL